ncbi:hypothetical protein B0H10DRAFT_218547 [Mycena sp. CBHHK59/15]|nr:hypothetical protein B0H10DRAFT_218547 [Mycena sp. CBHHK59/15]
MMPRPPPLQLHFDNMFPGMVRPRMQAMSLITGVYQTNWRILVMCITTINSLRFFLSAVCSSLYLSPVSLIYGVQMGAMDDLQVDLAQNNSALASISRTLAAMYTLACGIELFGALSVFTQRQTLLRIYAYLAFISAMLVTGVGVVTTAAWFTFADDLVRECVSLAMAGQLSSKSIFRGDQWPTTALSSDDSQTQCLDIWASESVSQVLSAALFYLLPSALFCLIAYIYYRQTTDPTHPTNFKGRGSAIRLEARGSGAPYDPLQGVYSDEVVGNANSRPSVAKRRTTVSPRSYKTAVAVVPVAVTSGSSLSPGPPSFSIGGAVGSDVYNGLHLSAGSEDDRFL